VKKIVSINCLKSYTPDLLASLSSSAPVSFKLSEEQPEKKPTTEILWADFYFFTFVVTAVDYNNDDDNDDDCLFVYCSAELQSRGLL